jgi:hypothetical protein
MKQSSEEIRLRYLYRKMIVTGKVQLSFESARRLVGPDCAFHLYQSVTAKRKSKKTAHRNTRSIPEERTKDT